MAQNDFQSTPVKLSLSLQKPFRILTVSCWSPLVESSKARHLLLSPSHTRHPQQAPLRESVHRLDLCLRLSMLVRSMTVFLLSGGRGECCIWAGTEIPFTAWFYYHQHCVKPSQLIWSIRSQSLADSKPVMCSCNYGNSREIVRYGGCAHEAAALLAACFMLVSCLTYSLALKLDVTCSPRHW
jgi:hypothetical protein